MPIPEDSPSMKRQNARTFVVDQLWDWIESGTLAPGEVIRDVESPNGSELVVLRYGRPWHARQLGVVERWPAGIPVSLRPPQPTASRSTRFCRPCAARDAAPFVTAGDVIEMNRLNDAIRAAAEAEDAVAARRVDEDLH
jgi:hypothetical protein